MLVAIAKSSSLERIYFPGGDWAAVFPANTKSAEAIYFKGNRFKDWGILLELSRFFLTVASHNKVVSTTLKPIWMTFALYALVCFTKTSHEQTFWTLRLGRVFSGGRQDEEEMSTGEQLRGVTDFCKTHKEKMQQSNALYYSSCDLCPKPP